MTRSNIRGRWIPGLFAAVAAFLPPAAAPQAAGTSEKLGVFFGSYGDADKVEEVKDLVISTISDEDMLPLPGPLRTFIAYQRWFLDGEEIEAEYKKLGAGGTKMRAYSTAQADAVAKKLREQGLDARGYTGFGFTFPYVAEGLEKAQKDGVNRLVIFYQGAQHSRVTSFIVFRDAQKYLVKHPEWNVKITVVRSFAADDRFIKLLGDGIQQRLDTDFAGEPPANVCIFLPAHGNILKWMEEGDPYLAQVMYDINALRQRFAQYPVSYGFQNHDMYPFLKWTQPTIFNALGEVARNSCRNVLINGRVSFTVDNLETTFDQTMEARDYLLEEAAKIPLKKRIVAEKMYNDDPVFVDYLTTLTVEALQGKGDVYTMERSPPLKP
jgi:ferrochelatase